MSELRIRDRKAGAGGSGLWMRIVRLPVIPSTIALLAFVFPLIDGNLYWLREIALIAIYSMVVSGLNLSFGLAGEVQFSQVFMFAVGAYVGVNVVARDVNDLIVALLISGLLTALVGVIVAIPAVRVGGWALAMVSFFLVIAVPEFAQLLPRFTGGLIGLTDVPIPQVFGQPLEFVGLYRTIIVVFVLWFVFYRNLVTSRYGLIFRILRESPVLCQSLGFSGARLKALAYALGSAPAGMAGCLFAFVSEVVTPDSFGLELAIGIVAASILGGVESVYGAVAGAAILQLGPLDSLAFAQYANIVFGAFLIVAALLLRGGLSQIGNDVLRLARRELKRRGMLKEPRLASDAESESGSVGHVGLQVATADGAGTASAAKSAAVGPTADSQGGDATGGAGLVVTGISKSFGAVQALSDVSLSAPAGQVTALIGANGSGKTTLLNVICGYERADGGQTTLGGEDLSSLRPERIARLGVRRTFQTPTIPRGASVLDVVASGEYASFPVSPIAAALRVPRYRRAENESRRAALDALSVVGLTSLAGEPATSLPLGTRRLIEVARAMCGSPRVVLLDEPASGLAQTEVAHLGDVLRTVASRGVAVVLVEHNFEFILSASDSVHVLDGGIRIATGSAADIANDPAVVASYLGTEPTRPRETFELPEGSSVAGEVDEEMT